MSEPRRGVKFYGSKASTFSSSLGFFLVPWPHLSTFPFPRHRKESPQENGITRLELSVMALQREKKRCERPLKGQGERGGLSRRDVVFYKKKKKSKAENQESDKRECWHRVTDLFGLLIAPLSHLTERGNRCYQVRKFPPKVTPMVEFSNFHFHFHFKLCFSIDTVPSRC